MVVFVIGDKNFGKSIAATDSFIAVNRINPEHQYHKKGVKISPLSFDKENTARYNTNKDDSPNDHIHDIRGSCR